MANNDKDTLQGNLPGSMVFGVQGKSAYQVAVENGFVGTVEAWLKSLVGPAGVSVTDIYDMSVSMDAAGSAARAVGKRRSFTIALSNGATKTFYYYDGANGQDGCGIYPWDIDAATSYVDDEGITHYRGGVTLPDDVTLKTGDLLLVNSGDVYRVEWWNNITGMVVSLLHNICGGYYTPVVTQPDDNTLELSFKGSKSDMPDVEPVQIAIPDSSGGVSMDGYATEAFVAEALVGYQPKGDYPLRSELPTKLPNPKTLTFTGAVETTYDGSEAVTVEIPAAVTDEHINELINEALAAIPDASEVAY